MGKKAKSILLLILIVLCAFLALALLADRHRNYEQTASTSFSAEDDGLKAFYLSVQRYGEAKGFSVDVFEKYARFVPEDSVVVCFRPTWELLCQDYEIQAIRHQIEQGSTYFLLLTEEQDTMDLAGLTEGLEALSLPQSMADHIQAGSLQQIVYYTDPMRAEYGGLVVATLGEELLNGIVKQEQDTAVDLILLIGAVCEQGHYQNVYFNEFYHGIQQGVAVDILGMGTVLFFVECVLILAIWAARRSVRFGDPEPLHSTVNRNENENVYALAGLYQRTKSYHIAFAVSMEALLEELAKRMGYGSLNAANKELVLEECETNPQWKDMGLGRLVSIYRRLDQQRMRLQEWKREIRRIEQIRKELE